jgi:hypothetical protein
MSMDMPIALLNDAAEAAAGTEPKAMSAWIDTAAWIETAVAVLFTAIAVVGVSLLTAMTGLV